MREKIQKNISLRFLNLAIFVILVLPVISIAGSSPVRGIYSLMKGMQPVDGSVLRLPFVAGVSIRASWEAVEPEEGKFNWSYLDKALAEVKRAKKKAMLRILPGVHSPPWIYRKGVSSIEYKDINPHHNTYGEPRKMPVPWDKNYLKLWAAFVTEFGKRYGSDEAVVLVHMAGPTVSSAEMHLPKRREAKELVQDAGYTKDRIVDAWKTVIDSYSKALPQTNLALNIAVPFRKDGAMEDIIRYAISKLGQRLCIQGNWLSAHTQDSFLPYETIANFRADKSITTGFQMLGASANESRQGSLNVAIQKGLTAGAGYFEIYEQDIKDVRNAPLLKEISDKLK